MSAARLTLVAFTVATVVQGATLFRNDLVGINTVVNDCRILAMTRNAGAASGLVAMKMSGPEHSSAQQIRLGRIDLTGATPRIHLFSRQLPQAGDFCYEETSLNGKVALAVAAGRSLHVVDFAGRPVIEFTLADDVVGTIKAIAISEKTMYVLTSDFNSNNRHVIAVDRASAQEVWRRSDLFSTCLAWHEGRRQLLCGGESGEVVQLDPDTGTTVSTGRRGSMTWLQLQFSPDGRLLLCADVNGGIRLYDFESMRELWILNRSGGYRGVLPEFTGDGRAIIVVCPGSRLTLAAIEAVSGRQLAQWSRHDAMPCMVRTVSPEQVVVADCDGQVVIWNWKSQRCSEQLRPQLQSGSRLSPIARVAGWKL